MAPVPEPITPAQMIQKRRDHLNKAIPLTGDERLKAEDAREALARQAKLLQKTVAEDYSARTGLRDDSNYVQFQMQNLMNAKAEAIATVSYIYAQKPDELGPEAWKEIEATMKPLIEKVQKDNKGFNAHHTTTLRHLDYFGADIEMQAKLADKEGLKSKALERWNLRADRLGAFMKANPLPENATEEQHEASRIKLVTTPVKAGEEQQFEAHLKGYATELKKLPDTIYLEYIGKARANAATTEEPPLPGTTPPPPGEMLGAPPPSPPRGRTML